MANKVYQIVTDRIIALLESGTCPWRKPWTGVEPANLDSGNEYRGINRLLLGSLSFSSPYFVTFKQAKRRGGCVRKGEKGFPVIYWNMVPRRGDGSEDESNERSQSLRPVLRYYTVFNVSQCDGLDVPDVPDTSSPVDPDPAIEGYLGRNPGLRLEHGGDNAFYRPSDDLVQMPHPAAFDDRDEYRSVLFHELVHSSGHPDRLNRFKEPDQFQFSSDSYSREELTAEMGAAFICGQCGISRTLENSAAYLASWLRALRQPKNVKLVIEAAGKAQRAADMIMGNERGGE